MRLMQATTNRLHIGLVCLVVSLTACGRRALLPVPELDEVAEAPARLVERGRHLALVTGCNDCHTPGGMFGAPDGQRALSGSELGWRGPWGVSYPRNLTPDTETGIANWSADQIVTAIRTGQRPNGTTIAPPMPWPSYAALSDEEAYAIAAYVKSLPPVYHRAPVAIGPAAPMPPNAVVVAFPPPPAWDVMQTPTAIGGGPPPIRVEVDGSMRGYSGDR
jgi:mono/diheme cytochrome c family protein